MAGLQVDDDDIVIECRRPSVDPNLGLVRGPGALNTNLTQALVEDDPRHELSPLERFKPQALTSPRIVLLSFPSALNPFACPDFGKDCHHDFSLKKQSFNAVTMIRIRIYPEIANAGSSRTQIRRFLLMGLSLP
jgi:hypothetical protein